LIAVENTPEVHNVVVCTLCSCYPWDVLGLPPVWYKSDAYRSRTVKQPRTVLAEFGVHLEPTVAVRVWDSTAETRYLVLPMRPVGTDGWDEARLATLVDRNCMIGVGLPAGPGGADCWTASTTSAAWTASAPSSPSTTNPCSTSRGRAGRSP
jgi:nitrile hydratase